MVEVPGRARGSRGSPALARRRCARLVALLILLAAATRKLLRPRSAFLAVGPSRAAVPGASTALGGGGLPRPCHKPAAPARGCHAGALERRKVRRAVASAAGSLTKPEEQLEVLYDGLCRVCLANKALLESQDSHGVLRFVNIAAEEYDAREHADVEFSDAMNELHVILPGGQILKGTDAVFRAYEAVGLDWAVGVLGSPVLRSVTDCLYKFLSENRQVISRFLPGLDSLREQVRSARFLQRGVAEGEGCSESNKEDKDGDGDDEDDDCTITEDKLKEEMGT